MSENKSNGFGNGLLLGIVLGSLLVLLIATKKGRRILRILSIDGSDKLKHLEGIFDGLDLDEEFKGESDYLTSSQKTTVGQIQPFHRVKPSSRFHFRGLPRHIS